MKLEPILLIGFFGLLFWLGLGNFWQHDIDHDFPTGYSASDAYQHQVRAEWVKEAGSYAREAPYIVTGYDDVVGYYMPGASHLAAVYSYASGLESYDALIFMVYLAGILSAFAIYFGIRRYNKQVALLSLPVMVLIFTRNFFGGFLLGQWPFIFGTLFLAGSFWTLTNLKLPRSVILVGLFVTAVALNHTSELIFVVGLIGIALLAAVRNKQWRDVKTIVAAGIASIIVSLHYLIIFYQTWGKQFGYHFYVEHANPGYGSWNVFTFQHFPIWVIAIMLIGFFGIVLRNGLLAVAGGLITAVILKLLLPTLTSLPDGIQIALYFAASAALIAAVWLWKPDLVKLIAPYMLLVGYASLIGFGPRAFQTRYMWPVTLAPLFGFGIYYVVKLVSRHAKVRVGTIHATGMAVVLVIVLVSFQYTPLSSPGSMYKERWDMFRWIQDNSEPDSRVLFFYGDGYEQTSMLYNAQRPYGFINMDDYIKTARNGTVKRTWDYAIHGDSGPGYPYRKGVLDFRYHLLEDDFTPLYNDICIYRYFVFDKVTGSQQLVPVVQYNSFVQDTFVQSGMKVVFENAATSVVRNPNAGGDCLA